MVPMALRRCFSSGGVNRSMAFVGGHQLTSQDRARMPIRTKNTAMGSKLRSDINGQYSGAHRSEGRKALAMAFLMGDTWLLVRGCTIWAYTSQQVRETFV